MYAFICMPQYARLQWHPMTITSGNDDKTVNFLIAGIGDWTQELARRCLSGKLPRLALDGPFTAPTQSALDKRVLVAVGAGVGVTPFISLLSTLVTELVSESKHHRLVEAHFYWMSRDPMEFVFAWQILRTWLRQDVLQSKIFVHLYTTAKDPQQDLSAFLFKEAVKRLESRNTVGDLRCGDVWVTVEPMFLIKTHRLGMKLVFHRGDFHRSKKSDSFGAPTCRGSACWIGNASRLTWLNGWSSKRSKLLGHNSLGHGQKAGK